jgi:anti-sigma regulatory factor (Ser/Thr protein kinase)
MSTEDREAPPDNHRRRRVFATAATDCPAYSETLPRHPEAASVARQLVTHALTVWECEDALAADARLIVTELVANAANHARGAWLRVTVTLLAEHRLQVAVIDLSHIRPMLRKAGSEDVGGRGLALVEAVSETWGTEPLPWGKRVWAELQLGVS